MGLLAAWFGKDNGFTCCLVWLKQWVYLLLGLVKTLGLLAAWFGKDNGFTYCLERVFYNPLRREGVLDNPLHRRGCWTTHYTGEGVLQPTQIGESVLQPTQTGEGVGQPTETGEGVGQSTQTGEGVGQPTQTGGGVGQPSQTGGDVGQPTEKGEDVWQPTQTYEWMNKILYLACTTTPHKTMPGHCTRLTPILLQALKKKKCTKIQPIDELPENQVERINTGDDYIIQARAKISFIPFFYE